MPCQKWLRRTAGTDTALSTPQSTASERQNGQIRDGAPVGDWRPGARAGSRSLMGDLERSKSPESLPFWTSRHCRPGLRPERIPVPVPSPVPAGHHLPVPLCLMIPLRDNIPSRTAPYVNYAVVIACSVVFFLQASQQNDQPSLVERFAMVPARVADPDARIMLRTVHEVQTPFGRQLVQKETEMAPAAVPPWLTLLTCTFLHGGWMHFLGNMWVLWIFGDNVEDRYGHLGYLIFYLACGTAASAAHFLIDRHSTMPTIGASGAIAGVMGAYFLLYPRARVLCLVPIVFFLQIMWLPAPLFLGIWFLLQFFQGTASITSMASGGVAWWAHIGGFLAGLAATFWLRSHHRLKNPVQARRPGSDRMVFTRKGSDSPWQ